MNLFTPNTDYFDNYYDKEKYLLVWRISIVFTLVFLILTSIFICLESLAIVPGIITFFVALASTIYLKVSKNFEALYWLYAITGTVMSNFSMNYVTSSTHYVDFVWMITCVLIAFIGLSHKVGLLFTVINVIGAGYFYIFSLNNLFETIKPKTTLGLVGEFLELAFAFFVTTYLLFKFAQLQNISFKELEVANEKTVQKSNENEVLIKEIHHRVKNNLQIIISLLRLQKNEIESEDTKKHFSEAINRIMVMSLIHQKLYNDKSLGDVKIKDYLVDLTNDICKLSASKKPIIVEVNSEINSIGLKTIVPLGLLVNELISNSIQHAFINKEKGLINIEVNKLDKHTFKLTFQDNGTWRTMPKDHRSFGLELIEILTNQLEGEFKKSTNEDGTTYTFKLKNIDLEN